MLASSPGSCGGSGERPSRRDAAPSADRPAESDPRAAICSTVDAGAAVAYAVVQKIFDDDCVTCHTVGADLVLEDGVSWGNLVGHPAPAAEACGGTLVVPGDPGASYLYQKLTEPSPCSGAQMPRGEFFSDPLPACVLAIIEAWIAEGAPGTAPDGG